MAAPAIRKRRKHDLPGNRGLRKDIDDALGKRGEIWFGWDSLTATEVKQLKDALEIADILREVLEQGATIALVSSTDDSDPQVIYYPRDGVGLYQPVDLLAAMQVAAEKLKQLSAGCA